MQGRLHGNPSKNASDCTVIWNDCLEPAGASEHGVLGKGLKKCIDMIKRRPFVSIYHGFKLSALDLATMTSYCFRIFRRA